MFDFGDNIDAEDLFVYVIGTAIETSDNIIQCLSVSVHTEHDILAFWSFLTHLLEMFSELF